jgi:hypothetical protein
VAQGIALDTVNWQAAVDFCDNLDFAGHTDWRLPTVQELSSLIAEGGFRPRGTPSIGLREERYWTSTVDVLYPASSAYLVDFNGYVEYEHESLPFTERRSDNQTLLRFAIAVRNTQP